MAKSGLSYSMHSAGTTVGGGIFIPLSLEFVADTYFCDLEGSWDDVMKLIGQAHTLIHQKGIPRVQTDIRVGSRYL
jgi:uncharacterized protein YqgV (UPF0045/DUF77 family)